MGTVYPGFFKEVIETQTQARFERQATEQVGDHILATEEWVNALAEHPFESKKKGKFLSFLKAKAKPMKPRKKKVAYDLKTTLQGYKKRKIDSS